MKPQDIFPNATPDLDTIRKMQSWLATEQADLADYLANKGKPGYYFGRGFAGDTRRTIKRIKEWLTLVTPVPHA